MSRIVIGIPVLVNKYTDALELNLLSLKKYAKNCKICILLHWDESFSDEIDIFELLKKYSPIEFKVYKNTRNAKFKQVLIDWIREEYSDYEYMVIMHSDVFLWRDGAIEELLEPYSHGNYIATFKTIPLYLYQSTYHLDCQKQLLIAPRISTWFFSLNIKMINEVFDKYKNDMNHMLFEGGIKYSVEDNNEYMNFVKKDEHFYQYKDICHEVLFDVGCFFWYFINSHNEYDYFSFGIDSNPDFSSMEINYQPNGIVHLEQFDPRRFDDKFYSKYLFEERRTVIRRLIEEYED